MLSALVNLQLPWPSKLSPACSFGSSSIRTRDANGALQDLKPWEFGEGPVWWKCGMESRSWDVGMLVILLQKLR